MVKLTNAQIKEIAENLGMGLRTYIHKTTGKILTYAPEDHLEFFDDEEEAEYEELEENYTDYIAIKDFPSSESFEIMEEFTEQLHDKNPLKEILINALNNRKPFRNFKGIVESSDLRNDWFAFRDNWMFQYVKNGIENYEEFDEEDFDDDDV